METDMNEQAFGNILKETIRSLEVVKRRAAVLQYLKAMIVGNMTPLNALNYFAVKIDQGQEWNEGKPIFTIEATIVPRCGNFSIPLKDYSRYADEMIMVIEELEKKL